MRIGVIDFHPDLQHGASVTTKAKLMRVPGVIRLLTGGAEAGSDEVGLECSTVNIKSSG